MGAGLVNCDEGEGAMAGRPWKTSEITYLVENAGRVDEGEICEALGRSRRAVEGMARRLRARGLRVDLRRYRPKASICTGCGRFYVPSVPWVEGCEVCRYRKARDAANAACARWFPYLPPEMKRRVSTWDARRQSRQNEEKPPKPPVHIDALGPYWGARARELYQLELTEWETVHASRECKAAQKRANRYMDHAIDEAFGLPRNWREWLRGGSGRR